MPRGVRVVLGLALALASLSACSNDTTTPTDTTPLLTTEVYLGTLNRGESGFYSFTVANSGTAAISLASLTDAATGRVLDTTLELGSGVPAGEGCNTSSTMNVSPALSAQISNAVNPGIYCARIADIGNLRSAASFAVRIVHP